MAMRIIAEWADKNNHPGPIEYMFAELKGQGNELDRIFRASLKDRAVKEWLRLAGSWSKGLMRHITPLQAADIAAYEFNKRVSNEIGSKPKFVRRSLDNLAKSIYDKRLASYYFGRDELLHFGESVAQSQPRTKLKH